MSVSRKNKATAILVDDHPGTLAAARETLKDEFEVLAAVADSGSAVEAVSILNPDLLIVDIGMAGRDGFETARLVREHSWRTRIVFLTMMEDFDYVLAARNMGASYVIKRRMSTDLLTAARQAMSGNLFFSPIMASESRTR